MKTFFILLVIDAPTSFPWSHPIGRHFPLAYGLANVQGKRSEKGRARPYLISQSWQHDKGLEGVNTRPPSIMGPNHCQSRSHSLLFFLFFYFFVGCVCVLFCFLFLFPPLLPLPFLLRAGTTIHVLALKP